MKKIYLGADHAGFALKEKIRRWLEQQNISYAWLGFRWRRLRRRFPERSKQSVRCIERRCGSRRNINCARIRGRHTDAIALRALRLCRLDHAWILTKNRISYTTPKFANEHLCSDLQEPAGDVSYCRCFAHTPV